jgi:hypothetical protein
MSTSSSEITSRPGWIGRAILYALIYVVIGIVFGALAGRSGFGGARFWRFAAWLCSAIAFGTHIQFERVTIGRSAMAAACHAAVAAAIGAFLLAVSAIMHRQAAGLPRSGLLGLALVIWPCMTAVAAFLVGMAAAMLMQPRSPAV